MNSPGLLCAVVLVLGACTAASPPTPDPAVGPGVTVGGLVIENRLSYGVTDVLIEAPFSGNFAGCGNLPPRTSCANRFEDLDYQGYGVVVRWKERGQPQQTPEFVIGGGRTVAPGAYFLRVLIFAPGQAGAELVPAGDGGLTPR